MCPRTGANARPVLAKRNSSPSRSSGSPNCTAPVTRCRTGRPSGAAACRFPNRSCSTRNWPPPTRRGWCWRSSDPPRRIDTAGGRHRRAAPAPPAGHPRRRDLGAGFSEPEAGSDLAALRTTAHREGDSSWSTAEAVGQRRRARGLVPAAGLHRPDAPKRKGHSYFLLDMTSRELTSARFATLSGTRTSVRSSSTTSDPGRQPGGAENRAGRSRRRPWGPRTRNDDAGTGRTPGQRRLPLAGRAPALTRILSSRIGWRSSTSN